MKEYIREQMTILRANLHAPHAYLGGFMKERIEFLKTVQPGLSWGGS